jgi:hypothetical protein
MSALEPWTLCYIDFTSGTILVRVFNPEFTMRHLVLTITVPKTLGRKCGDKLIRLLLRLVINSFIFIFIFFLYISRFAGTTDLFLLSRVRMVDTTVAVLFCFPLFALVGTVDTGTIDRSIPISHFLSMSSYLFADPPTLLQVPCWFGPCGLLCLPIPIGAGLSRQTTVMRAPKKMSVKSSKYRVQYHS